MQLYNPYSPPPGALLTKVLEIGAWNMVATTSVQVAHGLDWATFRIVKVMIISDFVNAAYPLEYSSNYTEVGGRFRWDGTNVICTRYATGMFDGASFDDAVMNRGFVIIQYVG